MIIYLSRIEIISPKGIRNDLGPHSLGAGNYVTLEFEIIRKYGNTDPSQYFLKWGLVFKLIIIICQYQEDFSQQPGR